MIGSRRDSRGRKDKERKLVDTYLCCRFFFGTQYHPEFLSRPLEPSPPFRGFILAAAGQFTRQQACVLSTLDSKKEEKEDRNNLSEVGGREPPLEYKDMKTKRKLSLGEVNEPNQGNHTTKEKKGKKQSHE